MAFVNISLAQHLQAAADQVVSQATPQELVEKTAGIVPAESNGRCTTWVLRAVWTVEAQQYAASLAGQGLKGDNWRALGMLFLDLKQVDQDLADWTT